jgi:hypothetical protein
MDGQLVSAVEWWKDAGRWTCSLISYDDGYYQTWLKPGSALSFEVQRGRYCVGYTTAAPKDASRSIRIEAWKAFAPCSFNARIHKGIKCPTCYETDAVKACLICDGSECLADPERQEHCHRATAFTYLATFDPYKVKVGVAHGSRLPQRWIEQGANLAKRIVVGNGIQVRKIETLIHQALDVLTGLRADEKIDTLWRHQPAREAQALHRVEATIRDRFPDFPFYEDSLHDLDAVYRLPALHRRPITLKIKRNLRITGTILGVKGPLLLVSLDGSPYVLNLKRLIGRSIVFKDIDAMNIQTALDRY